MKEEKQVKQEKELMKEDKTSLEQKSLKIQQAYIKIDQTYNRRVRQVQRGMKQSIKNGLGKRLAPSDELEAQKEDPLSGMESQSLVAALGLSVKKVKTDDAADKKVEEDCTTASHSGNEDTQEKEEIENLDITKIPSLEWLVSKGGDYLKKQLQVLGLKCGGTVEMRAQRLWDIKENPALLLSPKYIAKKKKR